MQAYWDALQQQRAAQAEWDLQRQDIQRRRFAAWEASLDRQLPAVRFAEGVRREAERGSGPYISLGGFPRYVPRANAVVLGRTESRFFPGGVGADGTVVHRCLF